VYSVPGFLIIPAGKSNARFVEQRPGTEVHWQRIVISGSKPTTEFFMQANFVKESQPGHNLNY
jgi:hypothetical protein